MSSNKSSYMFPVAAAVTAVALLATRSDALSPVLTSLWRLRSKPPLLASNDEGIPNPQEGKDYKKMQGPLSHETPQFSQEELTRAREMETSRADYDFSECTCAFDRAISVENTYGDDALGMVRQLPALFDQCKQLEKTPIGLKYAGIRLPIFILGSNKLEGTLSPNASEGDTFQFLLDYVERGSTDTKDLIVLLENRKEKGPLSWDDEGRNDTIEAWYEQCKCHLRALLMMLDWAKAGEPLTTQKLLLCHNELMKGSHNSEGIPFESRYRCKNESVYAGQYVFPVDVDHEENMAAILEKANSKFDTQHPVEWSCDLVLEVLSSHPFQNGNGRMAHMCYAYGLVRHGVPCAVVFSNWHSKSRSHYIEAVRRAQGQKGAANREGLYTMGTVGLFATLQNMCTFCETKIKSETNGKSES